MGRREGGKKRRKGKTEKRILKENWKKGEESKINKNKYTSQDLLPHKIHRMLII